MSESVAFEKGYTGMDRAILIFQ